MKQNCEIKEMRVDDLPSLLRLGQDQWKDEEWLTIDYLKSSFVQPGLNFVATIDDKIVGGVLFVFEDIVPNWIRFLIVNKEYRKQGIGRKLLEEIFKNVKYGQTIFVDTGVSDKDAIAFYEKMGFVNRGTVKSFYGRAAAYFYEKNIVR